jgi:O-methyltransferase involved in polyketide biosynthesis
MSPPIQDFMTARSRYAEDALAAAMARGATQYVVMGPGIEPVAAPGANSRLRVFQPAVAANLPLDAALRESGFESSEISFFSWLGSAPSLTVEAALSTLGFIGRLPAGSGVVFDYAVERSSRDAVLPLAMDPLASRFAKIGEAFRMLLDPGALRAVLRSAGFRKIEDFAVAGYAHLVNASI